MTIEKTVENGNVTLKPDGWLDTASSPELGVAVDAIEEAASLTLDFDLVEYMASAGLRQVVAAYKKAKAIGAAFAVINASAEVMSIFKMTGIDKKINLSEKAPL